ncbi:hypothetical protein AB0E63_07290 [Kribbella sp. NPDC026596]|uniref:hypothetical protein n=1 Tax=Kribbella sp. NPDC026596 TaxID=3155122 RepID=UPI0033E36D10
MGDRPFVWVDDEVGEPERIFFAGEHQLVHQVDAQTGLTATDFAAIRAWADGKPFAGKAFRPQN